MTVIGVGVWYLNPGSIGPRRFTLPVAMAMLVVRGARVRARLIFLDARDGRPASLRGSARVRLR